MLFIFAVIVYFLFYRIFSSLFFGDSTDCFPCRRRTLLLLLKKPENPSNNHLIYQSGLDSGVISVTLYSFLMLILCDQLFILITYCPSLFSVWEKPNWLLTFLSIYLFMPCLSSFHMLLWYAPRHTHTQNFCSGIRKKLHHTVTFLEIWILRIS